MTTSSLSAWKLDLIGAAVLLAVTAGLYFGVIGPARERWLTREATVQGLRSEREVASTLARSLSVRQAELRRLREQLEGFHHTCWAEQDRSRRIEWLLQLARTDGLTVESIEPAEGDTVAGRRVVPLRLTARGEFTALRQTLQRLRVSMPDVVLRSLEIVASPAAETHLLISADLLWVPIAEGAAGDRGVTGPSPQAAGTPARTSFDRGGR